MSDFLLTYDGFDPQDEGLREALTSTGNGYFCTRGTAEWEDAGTVHYPGTYAHGCYNRETTIFGGRPVLNEDLVNLPNWLVLKLLIEGDEAIRLDNVELLSYRHDYDIRLAMVQRELRFRDRAGRETTLRSRRFVSMAHSHQAAIEWTLTPENWSGRAEVVSALDGRVTNQMVARYRELEGRHLDPVSPHTFGAEMLALTSRRGSRTSMSLRPSSPYPCLPRFEDRIERRALVYIQMEDYIQRVLAFDCVRASRCASRRWSPHHTSRMTARSMRRWAAREVGRPLSPFAEALERHGRAWEELWEVCDVRLPGNERVQLLLRLHISRLAGLLASHGRSGPPVPPAGSTARPTAATCSGTSSTSTRSSTSGCPRSPAGC